MGEQHPIVRIAREAVEQYVRHGKVLQPEATAPELTERAGVFVSLHKQGRLRGCIGTFDATQANIAEEIVSSAISAATRDPRFPPVAERELEALEYHVDVLTSPEAVEDESYLDAKRFGVIVESGWRRGLLLPDLDGVDTVGQQIEICRMKAGIGPDEPIRLYRFEVKRYNQ